MRRISNHEFFLGEMNPSLLPAFRKLFKELEREYVGGHYRTEDNGNGLLAVIATGCVNDDDAWDLDIMFRAFHAGFETAQDLEPRR